ncbi:MAG: acyltransferase [Actinobacteria bacterium]|nr:acyltransferase [Actinomycetota bacterium]MDQ3532099.1 acyltransferase [Actinomycetota bacterium]
MSIVDRLLQRLLGPTVEGLVDEALDEQGVDRLYRYRVHGDRSRLRIDPTAVVNNALFNLSSGGISIGRHAFFGHNVAVLTGTHDINLFGQQRQATIPSRGRDVVVEEGVWIASDALVLGPCTIGAHAVVGAGSLVMADVDAYAVVAGRPAKKLRSVEPSQDPS